MQKEALLMDRAHMGYAKIRVNLETKKYRERHEHKIT
jgi:hypothetical protein